MVRYFCSSVYSATNFFTYMYFLGHYSDEDNLLNLNFSDFFLIALLNTDISNFVVIYFHHEIIFRLKVAKIKHIREHRKNNKDIRKICCNYPKIWTDSNASKRCRQNGRQCRPGHTAFSDLSVGNLHYDSRFEPPHDKTNKIACAPSEDSDQPGHPPSLIRVFAVHSMTS